MKGRKNVNNSKKKLVTTVTLMVILMTLSVCLLNIVGAIQIVQIKTNSDVQINNPIQLEKKGPLGPNPRGIVWDVQINITEIGGKNDFVIFGEATDATDGSPADSYDTIKPPAPPTPYIYTWLNDNIPSPYDVLLKDYRHYPGNHKIWNLSIQWMPKSPYPSTTVTISWSKTKINFSEYDTVILLDSIGTQIANMRTINSYTFICPPFTPQTFQINCSKDIKPPQILNHSPGSGETGDSYTFNASVFDDLTPSSSLLVKVNWVHGSLSNNETMTYAGGNYFVKTIVLSNYSTNPLIYHFYAMDTAKVPNINYTSQYSTTVNDDESPIIIANSGAVSVGTGDQVKLWVTATDNIAVTTAKVTIDAAESSMVWNGTTLRWEYVYTAPSGSTTGHTYFVAVSDAVPNTATSATFGITVNDNDPPIITNTLATPSSQLVNGHVNISATITDNINLLEKKVRITGPEGYTPVNISLIQDGGNTFYYNATYTITGLYNYSIWAKDTSNNAQVSISYQFDIFAKLNITMVLSGWNFISLPFNQTISKNNLVVIYQGTEYTWAEAVAAGHVVEYIFQWNTSSEPNPGTYQPTNILTPGRGYWMFAYNTCNIWATDLNPMVSGNYITGLSMQWNIFGIPVYQSIDKTTLIVNYLGVDYTWTQATTNQNPTNMPIVIGTLFGWTRTTPQGYILSDILNAGYGYWIYAYQSCILKRPI